jgi:Hint domain
MFIARDDKMRGGAGALEAAQRTRGIASGTVVATADGFLPVDFLAPGDRVVTRDGMRVVRAVRVSRYSGPAVTIRASALGHDRPDQDLTLPADTLVYLRDWRAGAIFGQAEALVPVARLVDGEFIAEEQVLGLRLYDLVFDAPQIVYAEGVELYCDALWAETPV